MPLLPTTRLKRCCQPLCSCIQLLLTLTPSSTSSIFRLLLLIPC
jgi:hypothetical protein